MKYGETLQQRSIPLWETYNVDYNDIKRLIKVRTTDNQGQAKSIPGSDNEAKQLSEFEDELYKELREQHQRIDLFVQSKAGEIARRLAHLDKQIAQLRIRSFASGAAKISIRRLERFSKAEAAALKVGEEIESLSRFVGAQSLAFQKLLKKYKKWTGSMELGKRFRVGVLDRPTSFSKRDFQPLLAQWTDVLASVRAPFEHGIDWYPDSSNARPISLKSNGFNQKVSSDQEATKFPARASCSAAELNSTWNSGSNIDVDTAFATLALGPEAIKAVYWVHPDNTVQVHVLLLKHTRSQRLNGSDAHKEAPSHTAPSSNSSPRGFIIANSGRPSLPTDEEVGIIVCDDLRRFAEKRSSESSNASACCPGPVAEREAASIRYCCNGDVRVIVGTISDYAGSLAEPGLRQKPRRAKFERNAIHKLFNGSQTGRNACKTGLRDPERVFVWLAEHQEVQPLVQIQARRTRFVGLKNSQTSGIWATLDREILMRSVCRDSLGNGKIPVPMDEGAKACSTPFPHAILEVRIEGDHNSDLIAALDASHLTERIPNFSLETHAVATLCKPHGMPRPYWLAALEKDIRKVPVVLEATKGRPSQGQLNFEQSRTRHTSISASSTTNGPSGSGFSAVQGEPPVTSAPDAILPPRRSPLKKKRKTSHRRRMLEKGLTKPARNQQQRYWNEFDDGSEESESEAYTIFVDPHASYKFPGLTTTSRIFISLGMKIKTEGQKVASWLHSPHERKINERAPLINGDSSSSMEDSDLSDDEAPHGRAESSPQRRYLTFHNLSQPPAVRARERLLLRSCMASFGASLVLLIVAAILDITGRRKAETTVDAGVIIGVAASLVFAIVAVGSMAGRVDNVGWVHRSIVLLVFLCVAVSSGALLASLG